MTRTVRTPQVLVLCVNNCGASLTIDADQAPKDWMCPACELEERDRYYNRLNQTEPNSQETRHER